MLTMQQALKSLFKETGLDQKMRDFAVYDAWRQALGPEFSKRARAVHFRNGLLTVETESSAQRHELASFTGESYRQQANTILGADRIRRITYKLKETQ